MAAIASQRANEEEQRHPNTMTVGCAVFEPARMTISDDSVKWENWQPYAFPPIKNGEQRFHFQIPNLGEDFIDLARSLIFIRVKLIDDKYDTIDPNATQEIVEGESTRRVRQTVLPIDLILQTMWKNINLKLNGSLVGNSSDNYAYKAYLEYLLGASAQTKKYQGSFMGSSQDSGAFNCVTRELGLSIPNAQGGSLVGNNGLDTRYHFMKTAVDKEGYQYQTTFSMMEYMGKLFCDLANQERYIVNKVDIQLELLPQTDEFRIMSNATFQPKLQVEEIGFWLCRIKLDPRVYIEIEDKLMSTDKKLGEPARYPFQRSRVVTREIPVGTTKFNWVNLFHGEVPSRVVVGLVDSDAFHGDYKKNPFYFYHFNLSQIQFKVGSFSVPTSPLECDFENGIYLQALFSLYQAVGKSIFDPDIGIDRKNYRDGSTLFGFVVDPTADESIGELGKVRTGLTSVEMLFKNATQQGITVIVYATFPDEMYIDENRKVQLKSDLVRQ